jgi:hypothetical protein
MASGGRWVASSPPSPSHLVPDFCVYLYQITETGLSASLTLSGTKFFRDDDLN